MALASFINNCHKILINNQDTNTQKAMHYIADTRRVSKKSIILHQIGYCPFDAKIPKEIQFYGKDLSNIKPNDKGFEYFLHGRVIVPIFSEFGEPVGVATRKPSSEPGNAWWNLARPFRKGDHLFLLDKTRKKIFKNNKIYVVEGYMDGVSLLQEGLNLVCALMGTALTHRKVGLMARYCNNICLCLDIDKNHSGQKAQEKAIYTLSEFGFCDSISVIDHLDIGQDPDEYVAIHGLTDFLDGERILKESEITKICKNIRQQNKK